MCRWSSMPLILYRKQFLFFYNTHDIGIKFPGMWLVKGFLAILGSKDQVVEDLAITWHVFGCLTPSGAVVSYRSCCRGFHPRLLTSDPFGALGLRLCLLPWVSPTVIEIRPLRGFGFVMDFVQLWISSNGFDSTQQFSTALKEPDLNNHVRSTWQWNA